MTTKNTSSTTARATTARFAALALVGITMAAACVPETPAPAPATTTTTTSSTTTLPPVVSAGSVESVQLGDRTAQLRDVFPTMNAAGDIFGEYAVEGAIFRLSTAGEYSLLQSQTPDQPLGSVSGIDTDDDGNLYGAGTNASVIVKMTPDGEVSVIGGRRDASGFADGDAATSKFTMPYGLAVDSVGNVYVGELVDHRIRKITPEGQVSTLAGGNGWGFADGTGSAAKFFYPYGIAIDNDDNVLVADYGNSAIRKITPAGVVTTVAGTGERALIDGPVATAAFSSASDLDVDAAGNIYVADAGNHVIRKITPSGEVSTVAGTLGTGYVDGTVEDAKFNRPFGITIDSLGRLYVADWSGPWLRRITFA